MSADKKPERVSSPNEAAEQFTRTVAAKNWYREQTARRDALLEQLGLRRDQREAIIDKIRQHFPDQRPEYLASLQPDRLAFWLGRVIEAEAAPTRTPGDGWSEAKSPAEWVKELGISLSTIKRRVNKGVLVVNKHSTKSWSFRLDTLRLYQRGK